MAVPNYGVLVGTATEKLDSNEAKQKNPAGSPHFQILIDAGGTQYRIAVNVKSDTTPPDLQFYLDDHYKHPILDQVKAQKVGFTLLPGGPNTAALDYIRGNLFDLKDMTILPATANGDNNDLNDIFNVWVEKAIATRGSLVYAFGSKWNDGANTPDDYFDISSGLGIHDIHMNQGSTGSHAGDNGVYTDGGLFIHFPDEDRWIAMFTKFQSQVVHTDDGTADPIPTPTLPEEVTDIDIFAALVNPRSDDTGHEAVYLLNTTDQDINIDGWSIADKNKKKEALSGSIAAGQPRIITLNGKGAQLSNDGGIITLLNKDGLKISGVSYTRDQAAVQGKLVTF